MHCNNPAFVLFSPHNYHFRYHIYFTSVCFVYSLTAYCGYSLFYCLCLLTFLLALYMLFYYLYCMFAFTDELFPFIIFMFLVVAFSFSLREVLLTFLVKLVCWCWTLLAFACLQNIWSLHQIRMRALPGRIFLIVGFSLSSF